MNATIENYVAAIKNYDAARDSILAIFDGLASVSETPDGITIFASTNTYTYRGVITTSGRVFGTVSHQGKLLQPGGQFRKAGQVHALVERHARKLRRFWELAELKRLAALEASNLNYYRLVGPDGEVYERHSSELGAEIGLARAGGGDAAAAMGRGYDIIAPVMSDDEYSAAFDAAWNLAA